MPRSRNDWSGASALWVTAAGWAGAARRKFGADPPIITPTAVLSETDCLATTGDAGGPAGRSRGRTSREVRQLVKDARSALNQERYRRSIDGPPPDPPPMFVWQHHELFHRAGTELAKRFDVPVVEYVHAPVVWEARRWGVERTLTGPILERMGEIPQLKHADLVCCVSDEVLNAVVALGAPPERVIVAPMAVDPQRFRPITHREPGERFTVGWVGSFRRFHALELLLEAASLLLGEGLHLQVVLVGDGFERGRLEQMSFRLGIADRVEFRGQISNTDLPLVLEEFDAAVITAAADQEFHYSPLKLREYMAMELPVVAPQVGDIGRLIGDGHTGLLYEAGDVRGLADALADLAHDERKRTELGSHAREQVLRIGTWDVVLAAALERLDLT
jgi:glycosyltransferase involved in cell wall biosynthesis